MSPRLMNELNQTSDDRVGKHPCCGLPWDEDCICDPPDPAIVMMVNKMFDKIFDEVKVHFLKQKQRMDTMENLRDNEHVYKPELIKISRGLFRRPIYKLRCMCQTCRFQRLDS